MNGLLLPAQIEGISTRKDRTIKLTIGTNEMTPSKAGEIFQLQDKLVYLYISDKGISPNEQLAVDQLEPELQGKTQSKRLRNVLYLMWKKDPEGFTDADAHYKHHTEKVIEHFKTKLDS